MRLSKNHIKISFGKSEFSVNEEKRTVKCRLFFKLQTPEDYDGEIQFKSIPRSFVCSTAKCDPGDTWNEEKGKKIALALAENKAYRLSCKSLEQLKIYCKLKTFIVTTIGENELIDMLVEFQEKTENTIAHNQEYIENLASLD